MRMCDLLRAFLARLGEIVEATPASSSKMPALLDSDNAAVFYLAVPAALTTAVFLALALAATMAFGLQ
jgi:hypothetical protein